ncbi:EAL domain-containing protein [Bradyrhizobium sp. WSM 1704]|uniref:putative bifunctional diguanylate cyclase/phosphodiesterase n=1 Tax=Bradyrhizobium semiaridum TaxID=2821404 RepID=UPI001CE26A52|nr:EAL domain-containing protein [Bradyrhizobium semiaridum]MCA6122618.1 EAL domain-containing protein [Bradyrhizobium semiaridum]
MFFSFRSWSLWRVVGPLIAIVLLQASLSAGSLQVMSAVRAYVAGESLWSKGQKDAIYYLHSYVSTGTPAYLQKFDAAIAVPLADRTARLALEAPGNNDDVARDGFAKAGNHDDDIGGLIWLFKYFRKMHHVAGAVAAWRNSDVLLDRLIEIRNEAANEMALHDPSVGTIRRWAERIGAVDAALSTLAVDFSEHLGRASRQVSALLLLVNAVIAACLAGIVLFHTRRMLQRRWLAETALAVEKERAQLTLASIGDAVIVTTPDDRVGYMNAAAERLIAAGQEAGDRPLSSLFSIAEQPVQGSFGAAEAEGERRPQQRLLVRPDQSSVPVSVVETPIVHDGHWAGRVMVIHDMTAERRLVEELAWAASHDALTGLANRRQFEFELHTSMSGAADAGADLMLIDLDQFKIVNDTCGHMAGDRLLKQVARLLASEVGERGLVGRLGGDEFGILLRDDGSGAQEAASEVAERIRAVVEQSSFVHEGSSFRISTSIGLVRLGDCAGVQDALRLADVACFLAKDKGRNRVQEHCPADTDMTVRVAEMSWVNRIRKGLDEGRFCLYEQEIRPVAGTLKGGERRELLLRLRDESGVMVPPGSFLPAAERYGLMPLIDRWVVRRAFEVIAERRHSPRKVAGYAINLSGATIGDGDFVDFVAKLFARHDVPPTVVCFEITETSAISNLDEAQTFIARLREIGCSFSLDDFGTGMSSIAYLKHLPVDFIKIDGSFVKEILNSKVDRAMVEMITKTAKIMQKQVVAEFVESLAILDELREIGVDYVQGYAIGKPVPVLTLREEKIA